MDEELYDHPSASQSVIIQQKIEIMACKEYPHSASKKLFYYSKFVYMSGEDSLTSSEGSSLMWQYSNDVRLEESELLSSSTISISSIHESPSPMPSPSTVPAENSVKQLLSRSEKEVRERYFQKLRRNGMLPEKPRKKSHHLIVFDWDDTLFSTSHMSSLLEGDWSRAGDWQKQKMVDIDQITSNTLIIALQLAEVCIITNSVEGWVDFCTETFMPLTQGVLFTRKIEVISARDRFQHSFPNDPQRWKTQSFSSLLLEIANETLVNVMSIGDSNYEMEAADQSTRRFDRRFVKTLKFREKPRMQQLVKQLKLVNCRIRQVFGSPRNLSIKLQPKQ